MASLRLREKDPAPEIEWVEGWEEKSGKVSMLKIVLREVKERY